MTKTSAPRLLCASLIGLIAASCAPSTPQAPPPPQAPPTGSIYHSINRSFTCKVPTLIRPGAKLSANAAGDNDSVSFTDDFGTLLRIESEKASPQTSAALTGPNQQQLLEKFFDDVVMPKLLRPASPKTTILRRDHVDTAAGKAFFVVVNIPNGSTLMETTSSNSTPHRPDSVRGLLLFPKQNSLYIIMNQEWPSAAQIGHHTLQDRTNQLLTDLRAAVADMTFQ